MKHPPNCPAIDRWCSPLHPIERRAAVVVAGARIGAVREQNLDGVHEAGLGSVMERRGAPAVGSLSDEALVVDTGTVAQEGRDKVGVILAPLVAGAREPDPGSRAIDARARTREDRCKLGMKDPAIGAD